MTWQRKVVMLCCTCHIGCYAPPLPKWIYPFFNTHYSIRVIVEIVNTHTIIVITCNYVIIITHKIIVITPFTISTYFLIIWCTFLPDNLNWYNISEYCNSFFVYTILILNSLVPASKTAITILSTRKSTSLNFWCWVFGFGCCTSFEVTLMQWRYCSHFPESPIHCQYSWLFYNWSNATCHESDLHQTMADYDTSYKQKCVCKVISLLSNIYMNMYLL